MRRRYLKVLLSRKIVFEFTPFPFSRRLHSTRPLIVNTLGRAFLIGMAPFSPL